MVRIGFIVEGDSEKILISSPEFIAFLASINIELLNDRIINAVGKNNLYNLNRDFTDIQPKVESWIKILEGKGAEIIFILLDFDNEDACITQFKSKVYKRNQDIVIVAKRALEAWYLSDTMALRSYLRAQVAEIEAPEGILNPFEHINSLRIQYQNRGIGDKKLLTRAMIKSGFTLENAANHPACLSGQYFLSKLKALS